MLKLNLKFYGIESFSRLCVFIATICLVTSCGKKDIVGTTMKMYNDGIERVEKSESIDDIQNIYDEVAKQVKDFKSEHYKEFTELDDSANTLQEIENAFVRICCVKLKGMHSSLETEDGPISVDDNGNFYDPLDFAGDDNNVDPDNPLNIIDYSYISMNGNIEYITVMTPNGAYLYNKEDAEHYYDRYASHFFLANMILKRVWYSDASEDTKKYVKNNLYRIVSKLPLDISYPRDVMENVNKIYYHYMENAKNLYLLHRDNNNSVYGYNGPTKLYLTRDLEHGGKLIIYDL